MTNFEETVLGAMNAKALGNSYEREFSYALSEWLTGEPGSSVAWRDLGSGSRHTVRGRQDKHTAGSGGDIVPTDPKFIPWFEKFYIDTKNYPDVNWVFGNPANQKSNEILKQWIKVVSQCPRDKMPIMPCKVRNRTTPEFIVFPIGAWLNAESLMSFSVVTAAELEVQFNKRDVVKIPKNEKIEFKIMMKKEFFTLNTHEEFYARNKEYINNAKVSYNGEQRLF